jgi:glucose/mannose transport system substrate-binding protein
MDVFKRGAGLALSIALVCCTNGCSESAGTQSNPASAKPSVEVMHWLTSDRDAAALSVVRNGLIARGGIWRDTPMPGAGSTGRAAAVNRIVGGQPPDVFQFSVGAELEELAAQNLVAPVPVLSGHAPTALPDVIRRAASHDGRQIAIPIAIRGENWLFYNAAALRDAGIAVPRTWPEFMAAAASLKAAGKTPLALGGQPWQERLLFNVVLLGVGGRDFYRQVYEQLSPSAIHSQTMLQVFQSFATLRGYVDEASPGRRWNQTTHLLVRGDAVFQFMGDWAKSEILAAGMTPGREIGCVLAPAKDNAYIMMIDVFVFSPTQNLAVQAGQALFASTLQDLPVQVRLAQHMGAIPANPNAPDTGFDSCSSQALKVVRDPAAQLLDPGLSLSGGLSGAIDDSISRFWNHREMTAEQGHALLSETFSSNP